MTAGADGTTIDGMSDERIQRIIESMRDKSYLPKPARREYIAKKNSNKKRPLGIQSGNDKLVQEVVKMILESIYEPVFKKTSHGFRPNKSCQTALYQIQKTFTGTNWFVEGDIHACFDSFNHHTIIRLLRKRIDDEMFLQLIWKFLKAGYMEQWTYNRTYSGVPQGSGVSPVLANVYLHELDKFMEEYAQKYNRGKKKQMNSDYKKVVKKASYYRCMGKKKWADLSPEERWERNKHLKMLEKQTRQLTPTEPLDQYYNMATMINADVHRLFPSIDITMKTRLNSRADLSKEKPPTLKGAMDEYFYQKYGESKQVRYINGMIVVPVAYCRTQNPMFYRVDTNRYTPQGRERIHRMLAKSEYGETLLKLSRDNDTNHSIEFCDNRLSRFVASKGKCELSKVSLAFEDVECIYLNPPSQGGTDEYANLRIVHKDIKSLIYSNDVKIIKSLIDLFDCRAPAKIAKLNKWRAKAGLEAINLITINQTLK